MSLRFRLPLLLALVSLFGTWSPAHADRTITRVVFDAYTYTTIPLPNIPSRNPDAFKDCVGEVWGKITGFNNARQLVGYCGEDIDGVLPTGFRLSPSGSASNLLPSGFFRTRVTGVNNLGDAVGSGTYLPPGFPLVPAEERFFIDGALLPKQPGVGGVAALAINDAGVMLGLTSEGLVTWDGASYHVAGGPLLMLPMGINNSGHVVGLHTAVQPFTGFIRIGENIEKLLCLRLQRGASVG